MASVSRTRLYHGRMLIAETEAPCLWVRILQRSRLSCWGKVSTPSGSLRMSIASHHVVPASLLNSHVIGASNMDNCWTMKVSLLGLGWMIRVRSEATTA